MYIYIHVFEFVYYIYIICTCYKKIYWLCQCQTIAIQNPPYATTISCTIKKMCRSTHECIFTSLTSKLHKKHTCHHVYLWWDVPMSVQFTNTNSLRCLHSILSLFKRTWRGRHFFCWGEPWRFSEWTASWQMPRWWLQTNQKSSCKKLCLSMFKTKKHLLVIRKVVYSCVTV